MSLDSQFNEALVQVHEAFPTLHDEWGLINGAQADSYSSLLEEVWRIGAAQSPTESLTEVMQSHGFDYETGQGQVVKIMSEIVLGVSARVHSVEGAVK